MVVGYRETGWSDGQSSGRWYLISDKCEVMDFGRSNKTREYLMNGRTLGSSEEQRDLGVIIHRSLKVAEQVNRVVNKVNGTLVFISQGIECKRKEVMLGLYRALVRPQLEHCVQFGSPHYRKDVIALEGVQRRFTRMLPGTERLSYKERLDRLGFFSLEQRTLRGR